MEYDARGNLTKQTDPAGIDDANPPSQSWTYDGNRVTSHTDQLGNTTRYAYDAKGQLSTTTYPDGSTETQTYTDLGQIKTSTDQLGRITRYEYNSHGDLVTLTSPGGSVTTYTYDGAHNKLTETDPRGNVAGADQATHDKYTSVWTYDAFDRILTATDGLGHTTTNTYDALGNLLSSTNPSGGVTTYTYDANGNVLTETDPYNHVTTHIYDAAGRETTTVGPDGAKTTSTYDELGQLVTETGPAGNVTGASAETVRRNTALYDYDAAGRQTSVRVVDPQHPDRYLATTTTYDTRGNAVAVTNPGGAVTRSTYDVAGRPVITTDPTGVASTTSYDALGRQKTTNSGGITASYTYDAAGQLTKTTTGGGATTTYGYDADGNPTSMIDPNGNSTATAYDPAGNVTGVTDQLGRTVKTFYDAANQVTKVQDPANQATSYGHDSSGHVNKVTTATGAVTQYAYDKAGQLKTVTTPLGNAYNYTYDNAGRVKNATTPEGRVTSYTYTPDGKPQTVTLPAGSIAYSYDTLGRTTKVDYSDTTPDITYSYTATGQPDRVSNGTTTAAYTHDPAGRVTGISRNNKAFAYTWDNVGRLAKTSLPDGRTQSYTYGDDSRLTKTTSTSGSTSRDISYSYDPAGQLTSTSRSGGPTTTRGYDKAGQLTTLTHTAAAGSKLMAQTISYSNTGNPTTVATQRGATTTTATYTYDNAGQITGMCLPANGTTCGNGDAQTLYEYDANGNRSKTTTGTAVTTSTYDKDDRPIGETTAGKTTSYTYDANGALAKETGPEGTRTYKYGLDANLYSATLTDGRTLTYTYDESGNRTARAVNGATDAAWTWNTLGSLPSLTTETNGAGTTTHQWISDPLSDLGAPEADTTGTTPTWLLSDFQGSVTDITAGNTLSASVTFDPFGKPLTGDTKYPVGFHGQYQDQVSGLYDLRARDYNPASGRFTTPDPASAGPGTAFADTYHYGYNRPTVLNDPSGQCAIICTALIGAAIGGGVGLVSCGMDHWRNCGKKIATGAVVGGVMGATFGLAGEAAAAYGVEGAAVEFFAGGAAGVVGGYTQATLNGDSYGWGDAANDFGWGVVGAGAGRLISPVIKRAIAVRVAKAKAWVAKNSPGPKPADLADVACAPQGGKLTVTAKNPSASEREAAQYLADQGNQVTLRPPVGTKADGGTSDLIVNGVRWDVYTPNSRNVKAILSKTAKKFTQVHGGGVIVDLRYTGLSEVDFGPDPLKRINGLIKSWGHSDFISEVKFINGA